MKKRHSTYWESLTRETDIRFSFTEATEDDYTTWESHTTDCKRKEKGCFDMNLHVLNSVERKIFGMIILFRYLNHWKV